MEETKYYVNRWYDDRSSDNPYSFELLATDEYIGKVGDIIEIQFGQKNVKVRVLDIAETTKKDEAKDLFEYIA